MAKKMVSFNIKEKCLEIIKNMYKNIKSCIKVNGSISSFFTSNVGVRQGENLSPFLFNIFLNDLYNFFSMQNLNSINCINHALDEDIMILAKLFIL